MISELAGEQKILSTVANRLEILSAKHTVMKELVPRQISVNLALIQI
jgi:hypothetical protein